MLFDTLVEFAMAFQNPLFGPDRFERPVTQGGIVLFCKDWMGSDEALWLFEALRRDITWEQSSLFINGHLIADPRMHAWFANDRYFSFGKAPVRPNEWTPTIATIKDRLCDFLSDHLPQEQKLDVRFNTAMATLYRGSLDCESWHADNEVELGAKPLIATISFGATRELCMKPTKVYAGHHRSLGTHKIDLNSGSLLVMAGDTQKNWLHSVPRVKKACGPSINLTFRLVKD